MVEYFCPECKKITLKTKKTSDSILKNCPKCGYKKAYSTTYFPEIISREQIKIHGEKLVIHKDDKDDNFGTYHAHNYEKGTKTNLDDGRVLNLRNKKITKKLKKKRLDEIKSKSRFFQ